MTHRPDNPPPGAVPPEPDDPTAIELRQEIAQQRDELDAVIDELSVRLQPTRLTQEAVAQARRRLDAMPHGRAIGAVALSVGGTLLAYKLGKGILGFTRHHPWLSLGAVTAGAWAWWSSQDEQDKAAMRQRIEDARLDAQRRIDQVRDDTVARFEQARDQVTSTATRWQQQTLEAGHAASEQGRAALESARQQAHDAADQARAKAEHLTDQARKQLESVAEHVGMTGHDGSQDPVCEPGAAPPVRPPQPASHAETPRKPAGVKADTQPADAPSPPPKQATPQHAKQAASQE